MVIRSQLQYPTESLHSRILNDTVGEIVGKDDLSGDALAHKLGGGEPQDLGADLISGSYLAPVGPKFT